MKVCVAQSCLTLCDPGSSVHGIRRGPTRLLCPWNSPGKNPGVGCHSLLQRIFPTQALCLLHCRWILYRLSHQGSCLSNMFSLSQVYILPASIIYITTLILKMPVLMGCGCVCRCESHRDLDMRAYPDII